MAMSEGWSKLAGTGVEREIVAESAGMRFTLYSIAPGYLGIFAPK